MKVDVGDEIPGGGTGATGYSAFISYNHKDRAQAAWLHRSFERFRVPRRLWGRSAAYGTIGGRLPPVFRDREELASSSDLAASVKSALVRSASLVVVCSPNSAKSKWVDQEVRSFINSGRAGRIFCVIIEGEPHALDPERECLPPALLDPSAAGPLAADARKTGDGKRLALLKLLAGILDIPFDELRQREVQQRQRRLALLAGASLVGLVLTSALAAVAWISRNEAVEQRDVARQRTLTAQRTATFVTDLFRSADPSQARGRALTVGEVLDAGAGQIRTGLAEEPAVRADMATTLADVYGSIGEFERARELSRWSMSIPHRDRDVRVRQATVLARTSIWLGDFERAAADAQRAVALADVDGTTLDPELLPRALIVLGEAMGEAGDTAGARIALSRAVQLTQAEAQKETSDGALALEALGRVETLDGDLEAARGHLERALAIRRKLEGEESPSVSDIMRGLARIALQTGRPAEAESYLRSRVAVNRRTLGANHRDTAVITSDLGRALLEQGKIAEARAMFNAAMPTFRREPEMGGNLAAASYNLGIAQRELGQPAQARRSFGEGLAVAEAAQSPLTGLILTELGDLECQSGDPAQGAVMLDRALAPTEQAFANEPWRAAWLKIARMACPTTDQPRVTRRSVATVLAPIDERWPRGTLYRGLADARQKRLRF